VRKAKPRRLAMLKKITFGFAFLATALLSTVPVYSQSASLIEAGKKEENP